MPFSLGVALYSAHTVNAYFKLTTDRSGYSVWKDQGELILPKLTPSSYEKLSRAKLLPTIEHTHGRDVLWCHPAFAHRRAYVHNGQELVCVSLAATNVLVSVAPRV